MLLGTQANVLEGRKFLATLITFGSLPQFCWKCFSPLCVSGLRPLLSAFIGFSGLLRPCVSLPLALFLLTSPRFLCPPRPILQRAFCHGVCLSLVSHITNGRGILSQGSNTTWCAYSCSLLGVEAKHTHTHTLLRLNLNLSSLNSLNIFFFLAILPPFLFPFASFSPSHNFPSLSLCLSTT